MENLNPGKNSKPRKHSSSSCGAMMTEDFMTSVYLEDAAKAVHRTEEAYKALWNAVRPKVGEVWRKDACGNGKCRIGWSFGAGRTISVEDRKMDYGAPHHLVCGCLVRVE